MDRILNDTIKIKLKPKLKPTNSSVYESEKLIQYPSILSQAEYPQTQYLQFNITSVENINKTINENKTTYASCNICSTFKCGGEVRQLCGKYACMKN